MILLKIDLDLIKIVQFWMSRDNTKHSVGFNTWVFILRRYKWHIHAGSWSLVNCWREGKTLPYIGCS